MQFLESPVVIIAIIALFTVLLASVGIFLAVHGLKKAGEEGDNDFVNLNKLEKLYYKLGRSREDRCVLYISVSLESYRGLYSALRSSKLFGEIKTVLSEFFSGVNGSLLTVQGEYNFVSCAKWSKEMTKANVEACQAELNKILSNYSALNLALVNYGAFFAIGSYVPFEEAINRAKQASYLAKDKQMSYIEWDFNSGKALEKKILMENNIEKEIDNNRFFLEYQPVLDAKTKEIIGAEVLSRLNSNSGGVINPGSFLSAVDSMGLSNKFDYYIFEKNCKWISKDKNQREGYKYTINFSRSTLSEPSFAEKIVSIAEKYDLKFSCLAVEILEDKNLTGDARKQMTENLAALKDKGVSILLDDFGSGYTTFGDLQNLDISIVKIDRAITQNAVTENGFIILKNIIRTTKDIGFKTLCEGVETKEQEEAVIKAGCDLLQGFYYYKPMPVALFEELCEKTALIGEEQD